jgi:hypothetical protein
MGLKKDAVTGSFILTAAKAVEANRTRRRKYVKHALQPRKQGFVNWLRNLFYFAPNPFSGSPIASFIGKQTRLVKACSSARKSSDSIGEDHHVVLLVRSGLHDHLADAETEADSFTDPLTTALDQEEAFLDMCEPEKLRTELEVDLQRELDGLGGAFTPMARQAGEDRIHLDNFRSMHGLPKTFYWGQQFSTGNIFLIMGIILFEFLLNSLFFAAANPLGIIGGASLALVLSLATVVLGVGMGIAYQYNHPRAEGAGWIGKIIFAIVSLGILFFLLLLTLARLAGEGGDLNMFRTAAAQIQVAPFSGLLDLPSLGYFFFSIGVICYTSFKYISIMGRFPGLRRRILLAQQSETAYDTEVSGAGDHFTSIGEEQIEALDSLPIFIQQTLLPMKTIEMDFENVVDQLRNDSKSIGNAAKLLTSYINSHSIGHKLDVSSFANEECTASIAAHDGKLAIIRERVHQLVNRDETQKTTIDRCRNSMNQTLKQALEDLDTRCKDIKDEQYREKLAEFSDNPASLH